MVQTLPRYPEERVRHMRSREALRMPVISFGSPMDLGSFVTRRQQSGQHMGTERQKSGALSLFRVVNINQ